MASSFLERFYSLVNRDLSDPAHSRRLTNAQRLEDFQRCEIAIWERLLNLSGQESSIGRTEAEIVLNDKQEYYSLPGNFRQFLRLERRSLEARTHRTITGATYTNATKKVGLTDGFVDYILRSTDRFVISSPSSHAGTYVITAVTDNDITLETAIGSDAGSVTGTITRQVPDANSVIGAYGTISEYEPGPGVLLLSEQRGMIVRPTPSLDAAQTWVLVYQKGPVTLHYAQAAKFTINAVQKGTPAADAGSIIAMDDYYNGSLLRIYDGSTGVPQTRQIVDYEASRGVFVVSPPFSPTPTGTLKYEICPMVPPEYDQIYALDVALMNSSRRRNRRWADLERQRRILWNAVSNYYLSNTADRLPSRNFPPSDEIDPYDWMER